MNKGLTAGSLPNTSCERFNTVCAERSQNVGMNLLCGVLVMRKVAEKYDEDTLKICLKQYIAYIYLSRILICLSDEFCIIDR